MALAKLIVLHVISAPAFVLGYLYVPLTFVLFLSKDLSVRTPEMAITAHWRPWLKRALRGRLPSFTLGYGYILADDAHRAHEEVHVHQFQDTCAQGFVLGTTFAAVLLDPLALLVWPAMLITMLVLYLTSWLRGGTDMHRDPEHERSAYSQTR